MLKERSVSGGDQRWAHFRFSVVGPLLAAPPGRGELKAELEQLAQKKWQHPITGRRVSFGASTIERWYYQARGEPRDPVGALTRKIREDRGTHPSLSLELRNQIRTQYRQHPDWSYQLHYDNLAVLAEQDPRLGAMPSYETVRRYMKGQGMVKRRRRGGRRRTAGARAAEQRFEALEIRSYESEYVNALWHLDFHCGSVPVLTLRGEWVYPHLLGILDDHSRLCCHAQWYLAETAENLVHGVSQAVMKRGLCRATMSDNGSAMIAAETVQGLQRLAIVHELTLPYSPYQNGKQEVFWGQVEGRLLSMLADCKDLNLARLNEATLAWVEMEYNRKVHSETGQTPLARFLAGKDVGRPCPPGETLRQAFTVQATRTQITVRYAGWDLTYGYLADGRSGRILTQLYPQDKHKNADGRRRRKEAVAEGPAPAIEPPAGGMAPLLRKLIASYAATGLPPAYLPKDEINQPKENDTDE